jgi:hypothetical protein
MPECDAYREPVVVTPHEGAVIIRAPQGAAVFALTPEAALESAERIATAAHEAMRERLHIR